MYFIPQEEERAGQNRSPTVRLSGHVTRESIESRHPVSGAQEREGLYIGPPRHPIVSAAVRSKPTVVPRY